MKARRQSGGISTAKLMEAAARLAVGDDLATIAQHLRVPAKALRIELVRHGRMPEPDRAGPERCPMQLDIKLTVDELRAVYRVAFERHLYPRTVCKLVLQAAAAGGAAGIDALLDRAGRAA